MEKKHYTGKYFRDSMPEWKKKKDFFISRYCYREPSFYISAFCANHEIKANNVSYFSIIIAIICTACYLIPDRSAYIAGAIFLIFWNILDCVDGNLARSVEKQLFGTFADALSSYILLGLICTTIGMAVYNEGGLFFESGCPWVIVLGALASSSDTIMRLAYQKYKNTESEIAQTGVIDIAYDKRQDINQTTSWRVRIEAWLGLDGLLSYVMILATLFHILDIVIFYCMIYNGGACVFSILNLIKKAKLIAKEHPYQNANVE